MNCSICNSKKVNSTISNCYDLEYKVQGEFYFEFCGHCKTYILRPLQTQDQLNSYYPQHYHSYNTEDNLILKILYRITYNLRFKKYYSLINSDKGTILDIGCSDGKYFDYIDKSRNISITGIEMNEFIAEKGRNHGRNIITGTLDILPDDSKFDLIIMNNLIEHVLDPVCLIQQAITLLKPDGSIFIETPNFHCFDFLIWKKYWGGLHTPRHTYIFSEESFRYISSKVNLTLSKTNYIMNTGHWALSVQNFLESIKYTKTNLRYGRSWYYKYLLIFLIPINLIQMLIHRTGSMEVTLKN